MRCWLVVLWLWLPVGAAADEGLSAEAQRPSRSDRSPESLLESPLSISAVSGEEFNPTRPGLGLDEALDLVPGVFAQSSRNFAQDTRVSIRGYGARAPFGIRGIRVLVDGFPTTLPDGQSELDSIDLAFVERLEVIRGPVSSLYGGGGGGTISAFTIEPTLDPVLLIGSLVGTDHLGRHRLIATGTEHGTGYVLGLASTRTRGYRDHSRARQTVGLLKLERTLENGTWIEGQLATVWAPEAQDPGGLTLAEVETKRDAANPRSRIFDAGEDLNQQRIGLRLRHPLGPARELRISGYHLWRDFQNRLPFNRRVGFDRRVSGGSLTYVDGSGRLLWTSGLDLGFQNDRRRNWLNPGGERGDLILKQTEVVRSIGPFIQAELALANGIGIVGGLRYDWTEFVVDDRFLADGRDDSDRLRFRELSPRFGIHYGVSPRLRVYANYATAFRVPTTTELAPSDRRGGFASDVEPERTVGIELGAKGLLGDRLVYDAALFALRIRNALVPFSDASGGGLDTFFHNAGEVRRRGLELGLSAQLRPGVSIRAVYTYSHFRYHDFDKLTLLPGGEESIEELDGHREPNIPEHSLAAELRLEHPSGFFSVLSLRHGSELEVNDENTLASPSATVSDLRAGFRWRARAFELVPVVGIRNWSGVEYDGSIRPNAAVGRYFEPAPETELYGGFQLRIFVADLGS